jgi:predicted enzyme related to lactoylglutathione lyase
MHTKLYTLCLARAVVRPQAFPRHNALQWLTLLEEMSGGIVQMPKGCAVEPQSMGNGMTPYYLVNSIEEVSNNCALILFFTERPQATERLEKLGAKTVLPKQDESGSGWFSNLLDVEGNRFGIYQVKSTSEA